MNIITASPALHSAAFSSKIGHSTEGYEKRAFSPNFLMGFSFCDSWIVLLVWAVQRYILFLPNKGFSSGNRFKYLRC